MAPVFRFNNLMFRYYETFRYGLLQPFYYVQQWVLHARTVTM